MTQQIDLDELLKSLRAGGVKRYRNGGLEIELYPQVEAAQPVEPEEELTKEQQHERDMSLLLRSSGVPVPARLKKLGPDKPEPES